MSEPIGVGIVGTGIMARAHAGVVGEDPRLFLAGWVSRSEKSDLPGEAARVHATIEKMLEDERVRVVIVATPDFAHTEPALAAIRAGRDVLIEKPMTMSGLEAERILAESRAAGVKVMTLYHNRFHPAYWMAKEKLQQEKGEPILAYARKNDALWVATDMIPWADRSSPSWFLTSHDLDLVTWYIDRPVTEVYATAVSKTLVARGIDTPDAVQAQVRFEGGAVATFEAAWAVPNSYPAAVESFVEVLTTNTHIHIDRKVEAIEIADSERMTYPRTGSTEIMGRRYGPAVSAVRHFFDVVEGISEQLIPLEHSVQVTWILEAIEASYKSGNAVKFVDGVPQLDATPAAS